MIATIIAFVTAHAGLLLTIATGGGGGIALAVARFGWNGIMARFAEHRSWLTLVALAAVAAWLYADYVRVGRDRDRAYAWRSAACASVGISNKAPGYKRGDCSRRVLALAAFERDALKASNEAMASAIAEANRKSGADTAAAQAAVRDMRAAASAMEKANASVGKDDRVGGDWFAALNRAGGLQPLH